MMRSALLAILLLSISPFRANGATPIDPPIEVAPLDPYYNDWGSPLEIAAGSQSMLALWWQYEPRQLLGDPAIYVRPMDGDGHPLSSSQIQLGSGTSPAVSASGDRFLVLWEESGRGLSGALFDTAGQMIRSPYVVFGGDERGGALELVPHPDGWRVFRTVRSGDGISYRIVALLVGHDGSVIDTPAPLLEDASTWSATRFGQFTILAWSDNSQPQPSIRISALDDATILRTSRPLGHKPAASGEVENSELSAGSSSVVFAIASSAARSDLYSFDPLTADVTSPSPLPLDSCRAYPPDIELAWRGDRFVGLCNEWRESGEPARLERAVSRFSLDGNGGLIDGPEFFLSGTQAGAVYYSDRLWFLHSPGFPVGRPVSLMESSDGGELRGNPLSTTASRQWSLSAENWGSGNWLAVWTGDQGQVQAGLFDRSGVKERSQPLLTPGRNDVGATRTAQDGDDTVAGWTEFDAVGAPTLVITRWTRGRPLVPSKRFEVSLGAGVGVAAVISQLAAADGVVAVALGSEFEDGSSVIVVDGDGPQLVRIEKGAKTLLLAGRRLFLTYQSRPQGDLIGELYDIETGDLLAAKLLVERFWNPAEVALAFQDDHFLVAWINAGDHIRTMILDTEMDIVHGGNAGTIVTEGGASKVALAAAPGTDGNWIISWIHPPDSRDGAAFTYTIGVDSTGKLLTPLPHEPRFSFSGSPRTIAPDGTAVWGVQNGRAEIFIAPPQRRRPIRLP